MKRQPQQLPPFYQELQNLLHPYIFALREGQEFSQNFLDYSLFLMHVHCSERLSSPPASLIKTPPTKKLIPKKIKK